jgi:hypothetical protein
MNALCPNGKRDSLAKVLEERFRRELAASRSLEDLGGGEPSAVAVHAVPEPLA